jgi:hypothetical protein
MASNSRLSAKLRTIDIAVKIMPISRLSATDTCKSSIGNSVIWVSTASRKPTRTFVIDSTNDIVRDCLANDVIPEGVHVSPRLDVVHAKPASNRRGAKRASQA